jgi:hypothetical protein
VDELGGKPNHAKFSKERVARQRTHLKYHLINKLCSMGSKCLALDVNPMCKK